MEYADAWPVAPVLHVLHWLAVRWRMCATCWQRSKRKHGLFLRVVGFVRMLLVGDCPQLCVQKLLVVSGMLDASVGASVALCSQELRYWACEAAFLFLYHSA